MIGKKENKYGENKKEVRKNYMKDQVAPQLASTALSTGALLAATKGEPLRSAVNGSAKKDISNFLAAAMASDNIEDVGTAFKDSNLKRLNPALPMTIERAKGLQQTQNASSLASLLVATSPKTRDAIRKIDGKNKDGRANKTMDWVEDNPIAFQALARTPGLAGDAMTAGLMATDNYKQNGMAAAIRSMKQTGPSLAMGAAGLGATALAAGSYVNSVSRKQEKKMLKRDYKEQKAKDKKDALLNKSAKEYLNDAYLEKIGE